MTVKQALQLHEVINELENLTGEQVVDVKETGRIIRFLVETESTVYRYEITDTTHDLLTMRKR